MDQRQFEARLVELEAEYVAQKAEIKDAIREIKKELESECAIHEQNIHDCKIKIAIKETILEGYKKEHIRKKSELYNEFARQNQ